jgi:peptidoglycan/LPS O-acetylase OafA/YrhL
VTRRAPALVADLVAVLVFVLVGRRSHDEGSALAGTVATAWPFVVGAAAGEVAALRLPPRSLRTGAVVVAGAVAVGLPLRRLAGGGTPVSFVLVATTALALLVLGWRVALRVSQRGRPTVQVP